VKPIDTNDLCNLQKTQCAKSCALLDNPALFPEDRQALETINSIWSELPPEIKIGVMKMIAFQPLAPAGSNARAFARREAFFQRPLLCVFMIG